MKLDFGVLSDIKNRKEIIDDVIVFSRDALNHGGPIAAFRQPTSGSKDRYMPYVNAVDNMIKSNFKIDDIPIIGDIIHDEELQNILKNEVTEALKDVAISGICGVIENAMDAYSTSRRVGYSIEDSAERTVGKSIEYCTSKITGQPYEPYIPAIYFVYT